MKKKLLFCLLLFLYQLSLASEKNTNQEHTITSAENQTIKEYNIWTTNLDPESIQSDLDRMYPIFSQCQRGNITVFNKLSFEVWASISEESSSENDIENLYKEVADYFIEEDNIDTNNKGTIFIQSSKIPCPLPPAHIASTCEFSKEASFIYITEDHK